MLSVPLRGFGGAWPKEENVKKKKPNEIPAASLFIIFLISFLFL
jgi:hypothetical protein